MDGETSAKVISLQAARDAREEQEVHMLPEQQITFEASRALAVLRELCGISDQDAVCNALVLSAQIIKFGQTCDVLVRDRESGTVRQIRAYNGYGDIVLGPRDH